MEEEAFVHHIFHRIGSSNSFDRLYLMRVDQETKTFTCVHEYVSGSTTPRKRALKNASFSLYPTIIETVVEHGKSFSLDCVGEDSPDAVQLMNQGIEGIVLHPVFSLNSPKCIGFLGAETSCARQWNSKDLLILEMLCEVILSGSVSSVPIAPRTKHQKEIDAAMTLSKSVRGLFEKWLRWESGALDKWEEIGIEVFEQQLLFWILRDEKIRFVLPAFPCKSGNPKKVLSPLPDMAEKLCLQRLDDFAKAVAQIYPKGCDMMIISDGRVFSDLVDVSDELVNEYRTKLMEMARDLKNVSFYSLDDSLTISSPEEARLKLMAAYGSDLSWVEERLERDEDFTQVYIGFKRFMQRDLMLPPETTKTKRIALAASTAKMMCLRNEAYSNFTTDLFPHHVRLSIHQHSNIRKFSVKMMEGKPMPRTPWHSVAVKIEGKFVLMNKEDAIEMGAKQVEDYFEV